MSNPYKYLLVYSLPIAAAMSFTMNGVFTFAPVILAFVIIPSLELVFKPNALNLSENELQKASKNKLYDWFIYLIFPIQWVALLWFLYAIQENGLTSFETIGRISAYGMLCGVLGINVAHELGHRSKTHEKLMAKGLLLSTLYLQFYIEHNKGHHKHVATPNDPSTAKYKQSLYSFWLQTFQGTYVKAWQIAIEDAQKRNSKFPVVFNEMAFFQIIQIGFCLLIYFNFGLIIFSHFLVAAFIGAALLETVNYIEHYGLQRQQRSDQSYERVLPAHSWNSNHVIGRLIFFELSRHSDHHYMASRKYQVLRHMEDAPQMPTGYPGMILLALLPPVWFSVMDKQMKKYSIL